MADELVFPKVTGDYLFPGDVNRFNPKVIGVHQLAIAINVSGTNFTLMGSVDYLGTELFSSHLNIATAVQKDGANFVNQARLRVSGAGLNMVTVIKNTPTSVEEKVLVFNHILTSGALTASGGNVGSPYVISVEGRNNVNDTRAFMNDFAVWGF